MSLRDDLIRLAFEEPSLREDVLPLLKRAEKDDVSSVDPDSTMVAIYPPDAWSKKLEKYTHPSQKGKLHTTLVYLGKRSVQDAKAALMIVQGICAKRRPLELYANGVGAFFNNEAVVRILMPNGMGLCELRAEIFEALEDAELLDEQSHGFIPHMTLEYHVDGKLAPGWEQVGNLDLPPWDLFEVSVVRGDQLIGTCNLGSKDGGQNG